MQKTRNIWSSVPSTDYVDDVMRENPRVNDLQHEAAGMRRRLRMPDVD